MKRWAVTADGVPFELMPGEELVAVTDARREERAACIAEIQKMLAENEDDWSSDANEQVEWIIDTLRRGPS